MHTTRNKLYLCNWLFVACTMLLLFNDQYLKFECSNWLTGKLSDIAGIIILPLILAFALPKQKQLSVIIAAVLFVFWKCSFSQPLIDFYNAHSFIQTSRIVDYSDLFVLVLLPLPNAIIRNIDSLGFLAIKKIPAALVLLPTVFTLMATSPPPSFYYTKSEGNLRCPKCNITLHETQEEIVRKLQAVDIVFDSVAPVDSYALERVPRLKDENAHVYRLNQLVIAPDTLRNLDFTMLTLKNGKTKLYFNGMNVSADISTTRLESNMRHYYKRLLFKYLKTRLF